MNPQELDKLIERYFDGTTSLEEERRLRRALAATGARGDNADQARAVMGLAAAQRCAARPQRSRHSVAWRAAAGLALLVAAGASVLLHTHSSAGECSIAYADGSISHDRDDVLAVMQADLDAIADAATSVDATIASDFGAISDILNNPQ